MTKLNFVILKNSADKYWFLDLNSVEEESTLCQKSRRTLNICKCKALCFKYCCFKLCTTHIVQRNPR